MMTDNCVIATLETFYHAVAILSCRGESRDLAARSSSAQVRQSLSAARITSIAGQEFHDQLSMIPIVPYAVSLSLSVAYQNLRHTKVPMYQERARGQIQANCDLLRELGNIFWSASLMADMGEEIVREMDRVSNSLTHPQLQRLSGTRPPQNQSMDGGDNSTEGRSESQGGMYGFVCYEYILIGS
jgi:hypothetical protein